MRIIYRAFEAKKSIYFVMAVCAACLLTSCKGMYVPYSSNVLRSSTEVLLSQPNFRVVRNAEVVVEINNSRLRRADVEKSAFAELMRQYPLTGSQTYTHVVFEEIRREGRHAKQYIAVRAVIIEFVQPNGKPIASAQSPYAEHPCQTQPQHQSQTQVQPQKKVETTKQIAESIKDLAKKEANRYYIALLFKTKKLNSKKIFEYDLYNCFFGYNTTNIAQENSEEELQIKSKEHDKIFEQFAIQ